MIFIIVIYLVTILNFSLVKSSHFCGGTVTWKPVTNIVSGSTIPVTFTQTYHWRLANTHSNDSYILNQSPLIPVGISYLQCVTYTTSACNDYILLPVAEYCSDFSTNLDSSSCQMSTVENIIVDSQFCVAYQSGSWIPLKQSVQQAVVVPLILSQYKQLH